MSPQDTQEGTVLDHAVLIPKPESGGPWILPVVSGVFFWVQFGGKIFFLEIFGETRLDNGVFAYFTVFLPLI